jgi:hypothetical protein
VTDVELLAALHTLRSWLTGGHDSSAPYDQNTRPPGVTRDGFLRRHRQQLRAKTPGWSAIGKARLVTRAAWDSYVAGTGKSRKPTVALSLDVERDEIDRALGIKVRRAA